MDTQKKKLLFIMLIAVLLLIAATNLLNPNLTSNPGKTYIISMDKNSLDWIRIDDTSVTKLVNQLLDEGVPVNWALEEFTIGNKTYPAGTFYITTPFTTSMGVSSDDVISWLSWEAKTNRIFRIDVTSEKVDVESKELVLPRIALFYDHTTYDNALAHFNKLREIGFKVFLVNAVDLISDQWDAPGTALEEANVFFMPGGALHFWSFGAEQEKGIANIQQFIESGGGYVGVCAGATETLIGSPFPYLNLVDASYRSEWFNNNDWDWRQLIGPIYIEVEMEDHPVMFGYGSNAVRPGYGPQTMIYYYGGPAMHSIGAEAEILATFSGPVTQNTPDSVDDIWGSAAILTQEYGQGKAVIISPHPEWPGPGGRIFAQSLYYVANVDKPCWLDSDLSMNLPDQITDSRVDAIRSTVKEIEPVLENSIKVAASIVNLRAGDHYHALGLWYDGSLLNHVKDAHKKLKEIQRFAIKFQYEYQKLNIIKEMVQDDPDLIELIEYSQAMISEFFALTEEFAMEPHFIAETCWTEAGPYEPFAHLEPASFSDLPPVFEYIDDEINNLILPFVTDYAELFQEYENLRLEVKNNPTPELEEQLDEKYNDMRASWAAGPLYQGMFMLRHTLDVLQYKVNYHLLSQITHADRVEEVLSLNNHVLAEHLGQWRYTAVIVRSLAANPLGGVIK